MSSSRGSTRVKGPPSPAWQPRAVGLTWISMCRCCPSSRRWSSCARMTSGSPTVRCRTTSSRMKLSDGADCRVSSCCLAGRAPRVARFRLPQRDHQADVLLTAGVALLVRADRGEPRIAGRQASAEDGPGGPAGPGPGPAERGGHGPQAVRGPAAGIGGDEPLRQLGRRVHVRAPCCQVVPRAV